MKQTEIIVGSSWTRVWSDYVQAVWTVSLVLDSAAFWYEKPFSSVPAWWAHAYFLKILIFPGNPTNFVSMDFLDKNLLCFSLAFDIRIFILFSFNFHLDRLLFQASFFLEYFFFIFLASSLSFLGLLKFWKKGKIQKTPVVLLFATVFWRV